MELEAVLTPVTVAELAAAFNQDLTLLRGFPPSHEELVLAVAHPFLETGAFQSLYDFNVGNAKATDGWIAGSGDHCFYACGEELTLAYAEALAKAEPALVHIVRRYPEGAPKYASVNFLPKHRMTRFRAFRTLAEAVRAHLESLRNDFPKAWAALATGDVEAYVYALHAEGYFTADPAIYLHGADGRFGLAAVVRQLEPQIGRVDAATGEVVRDLAIDPSAPTGAAVRGEAPTGEDEP